MCASATSEVWSQQWQCNAVASPLATVLVAPPVEVQCSLMYTISRVAASCVAQGTKSVDLFVKIDM